MDPNIAIGIVIMDNDEELEVDRELEIALRVCLAALRDASNPLESMPRRYFRHHYRLQKETVAWLCEILIPRIQQLRSTSIPILLQVICTLRFFAQGSYERSIGESEHFCFSQASVSRVIDRVSAQMGISANEWVQFPRTAVARARSSQEFNLIAGFPGIIGCIDGTQITIYPPVERPWMYLNHNRTYSLNVQATCDYDMSITSLVFFPGSTHDARIWRQSAVKQEMDRLHRDRVGTYHLLGDQGYPLQPGMSTPYRNPEPDSPEARCNAAQTHTRSMIERVFGRLRRLPTQL